MPTLVTQRERDEKWLRKYLAKRRRSGVVPTRAPQARAQMDHDHWAAYFAAATNAAERAAFANGQEYMRQQLEPELERLRELARACREGRCRRD